ncbi:hypothetical protein LED50_26955 [Salmonella enterica]|nr:hypothetical protein [Salmonella enterica]
MDKNTAKRSCTAGIPDFVPRKSTTDAAHHSQAKSTYYVPDTPEQTLPPVTPCFSQADIDEFLARKPKQYKMTDRDYKELGRNTLLGIGDLIIGTAATAIFGGSVLAEVMAESSVKPLPEDNYYTWNGYDYIWYD